MKVEKKFMNKAINIARISYEKEEYPVGVVIVRNGEIISTGRNKTRRSNDPTSHGEIDAIRKACKKLNSKYLNDCVLYTTHEPCPMCAGASIWAKMKGIVFGLNFKDSNNNKSKNWSWRQINIPCREILNKGEPKLELNEEFMREECLKLFNLTNQNA